jgi:hypothetical protein
MPEILPSEVIKCTYIITNLAEQFLFVTKQEDLLKGTIGINCVSFLPFLFTTLV